MNDWDSCTDCNLMFGFLSSQRISCPEITVKPNTPNIHSLEYAQEASKLFCEEIRKIYPICPNIRMFKELKDTET